MSATTLLSTDHKEDGKLCTVYRRRPPGVLNIISFVMYWKTVLCKNRGAIQRTQTEASQYIQGGMNIAKNYVKETVCWYCLCECLSNVGAKSCATHPKLSHPEDQRKVFRYIYKEIESTKLRDKHNVGPEPKYKGEQQNIKNDPKVIQT